jgi:hypothetical protein
VKEGVDFLAPQTPSPANPRGHVETLTKDLQARLEPLDVLVAARDKAVGDAAGDLPDGWPAPDRLSIEQPRPSVDWLVRLGQSLDLPL